MSAYIPAIIWLIGIIICIYIAKRRHVAPSFSRNLIVALLGPFAIPLVFFAKTDTTMQTNK
jgi:hypothetical protein